MLLAQPLSRHRGFCLLETFLRIVSPGIMEESLTWGGAGLLWWVMGLHCQHSWGSRNAGPRGRQALVPSTSSTFFTCSKQWYVTENLLSVSAEIILTLLLPLLIPIFCTHPVQGKMKGGDTMEKCLVSSKMKILQYARAGMSRRKAALRICGFVSAVTHAWNTPEMCTAWPAMTNYRSSFLPLPTNFPHSADLADILSCCGWLFGEAWMLSFISVLCRNMQK